MRFSANLRESGHCRRCRATNRQRQLAHVIVRRLGAQHLAAVHDRKTKVFNTESSGPLHDGLRAAFPSYYSSEYLGADVAPGTARDGVAHQDLMALTLPDESVDLVVSSDVLEHVPDPYRAHGEIHRVLRPGGRHIFTVPFDSTSRTDHVRASIDDDGTLRYHQAPMYHDDPLRPQGVLVFTIFGSEMMERLAAVGFSVRLHRLHDVVEGILGDNAFVFEAEKRRAAAERARPVP